MKTIEERVRKLERWNRILITLFFVAGLGVVMGQAKAKPELIEAGAIKVTDVFAARIQLQDGTGKTRVYMSVGDAGPVLDFQNAREKPLLSIGISEGTGNLTGIGPHVSLMDERGRTVRRFSIVQER